MSFSWLMTEWQSHRMNWKYWFKTGKHMKTESWWLVDHNLRVFCLKLIAYVVVKEVHLQDLEISNESTPNKTFKFEHEEWYSVFGDTSLHVVLFVFLSKHFSTPKMRRLRKHEKQKTYASTESWVGHNFRIHLFIFVILWETRVLHKAFEHEWIWWFDKFV